jgi:hypothetical protein
MSEEKVISPLLMDRSNPLGNSDDGTGRRALHVKPISGSFVTNPYDEILVSYPNAFTEVYTYRLESSIVNTVTVIYSDLDKQILLSVTKT